MKDKRRLLLIAYCYPPMSAVGSIRAHNISKYLARLGWHVTVVTPGARSGYAHEDFHKVERPLTGEGITVVQTGHSLRRLNPEVLKCRDTVLGYLVGGCLRRAARLLDLEREIGWRPHLRKACRKFRPGDFDVILATGSPFFAFEVARELSQGLTCPFIVDYRDLWNGNVMTRVHRKSIVKREEAVLRYCSSATIVSPSLKQYLEQRFHVNGKVHVITNGFDPEECERVEPHSFDHFAIVYAGIFYPSLRTITPVMQALHSVANTFDPDGWRFHY